MSLTRSLRLHRWAAAFVVSTSLTALRNVTASGQGLPPDARSAEATRAELRSLSDSLQHKLKTDTLPDAHRDSVSAQADEITRRLRDGDFISGDRIVLHVQGEPTLNDTLIVRAEQVLPMPGLTDMPLHGVLRSELRETLRIHLNQFLRDPLFTVTPLIRLAVVGEVARPGFYSLAPDARMTDAIMLAGGPTANGDLSRLRLSRAGHPLASEEQMRDIVARGLSLDLAGVTPGDALVVGQRARRDPQLFFQAGTVLLTAVSTFLAWTAISRRH
jgi:protein involved in polysaccharide export with SLBB domain